MLIRFPPNEIPICLIFCYDFTKPPTQTQWTNFLTMAVAPLKLSHSSRFKLLLLPQKSPLSSPVPSTGGRSSLMLGKETGDALRLTLPSPQTLRSAVAEEKQCEIPFPVSPPNQTEKPSANLRPRSKKKSCSENLEVRKQKIYGLIPRPFPPFR